MNKHPPLKFATLLAALVVANFAFAQESFPGSQTNEDKRAHDLFVSTSAQLLKDMDREKGRAGYRQVIQIDPHCGPAWFNLGALAEAARDWEDAKTDFEQYLLVAPTGPYRKRAQRELDLIAKRSVQPSKEGQYDAAIGRAWALLASKFFKEAIEEAAFAQSLDNSRWDAYAIVSFCMAKQGKIEEAEKFARLALDRSPSEKRQQIQAALAHSLLQPKKDDGGR